MPRFVILTHDHPFPHWDLMLETGSQLRAWRLLEKPAPETSVRAEALGDHRLLYLDYEGPVSGGRGQVFQWDRGTFEIEQVEPQLRIVLCGERVRTTAELDESPTGGILWTFGRWL